MDRSLAEIDQPGRTEAAIEGGCYGDTRVALTQKLRRMIDEGVGYGLALEGISAADVARANRQDP